MEEKELQAGNSAPEMPIVEAETNTAQEPLQTFEMSAPEAPEAPAAEAPAPRPPVKEAVKEKKAVRVSNFMRRGGLFEGYEISSAKEMPFFMRIFAASALFHLVLIASALQLPAVVQTTCESTEFTQKLCDTMYVASLLSGSAGGEYVDQPYDATQIPDAADVTFITTDSFQYPEGYWTLRDELEGRATTDPMMIDPSLATVDGINNTGSPTTLDLNARPNLPNVNSGGVSGAVDSPFSVGSIPPVNPTGPRTSGKRTKRPPLANDSPGTLPPVDDAADPTAAAKPATNKKPKVNPTPANPAKPQNPDIVTYNNGKDTVQINKKPLKDFAGNVADKIKNNEVNLQAPFVVVVDGILDKNGRFDKEQTKFIRSEGDEKMVELAKEAINAVSESGWLGYLKVLGNKRLSFTMQQDQDKILVTINSEVESEEKAKTLSSGLNTLISVGKMTNKGDEKVLLENAAVTYQGNVFVLNFSMPQQIVQPMIQRKLADADNKNVKPSSEAVGSTKSSSNSK